MIWLVVLLAHIAVVKSVLPTYLPNPQESYERDDLIVKYFRLGMKYTEILMFLASACAWHSAKFTTIEKGCNKARLKSTKEL